ncbi:response regulator transcription factor [Alloalcanivorax gelatiniphagus]
MSAVGAEGLRVLLVDDQPLVRMGFRMLLDAESDLEVVGEAGDGERAVAMARALRPDVVLMDVRMPVLDGIAATAAIVADDPHARVLVVTTFDLDESAFAALRAGASGFLLKDARPEELVSGIRSVAAGDAVVAPRVTRALLDAVGSHLPDPYAAADPALARLTPRELDVATLVARGLTNGEIAAELVLSEATVKGHMGRLLDKLALRDRVQLVIWAYRAGLVD